jgi:hypothetical protein
MPIRRYLEDNAAFDPDVIKAMSEALERACAALHVNGQLRDREVIAVHIIDLARNGILDAKVLSDRVVAETKALRALYRSFAARESRGAAHGGRFPPHEPGWACVHTTASLAAFTGRALTIFRHRGFGVCHREDPS